MNDLANVVIPGGDELMLHRYQVPICGVLSHLH